MSRARQSHADRRDPHGGSEAAGLIQCPVEECPQHVGHERLHHQGDGSEVGEASQKVRQGGTEPAGDGPEPGPQDQDSQEDGRVPQVDVASGGYGGDPHQIGEHQYDRHHHGGQKYGLQMFLFSLLIGHLSPSLFTGYL